MRLTCALLLPVTAALAALALAGCQTTYPVASTSRSDLDALAYGQPAPTYSSYPEASADGGGAIAALRASLENAPRETYAAVTPAAYPMTPAINAYAATPVAYATTAHDTPDRLDAGDTILVSERWF